MVLTDDQVANLCKFGRSDECCVFLVMNWHTRCFSCAKADEQLFKLLNRIRDQLDVQNDNCSGPPTFVPS